MKRFAKTLWLICMFGWLMLLCLPAHSKKNTEFIIADVTGDWGFPHPFAMYPRGPGYVRMSLVFDTLVWKTEQGVMPALALKWETAADYLWIEFRLRDRLSWHDGHPLTADDVLFTFQYFKEHSWPWVDLSMVKEVKKTADHGIRILLHDTYAPFITNVAGCLPILPKHVWQQVKKPAQFRDKAALVGSGPFFAADYSPINGSYLFLANPTYYLGAPLIEKLIFIKAKAEFIFPMLTAGRIHAGSLVPDMITAAKERGLAVISEPPSWGVKLVFNLLRYPFSEKYFRQALAFAIDRQKLVSIIERGHAIAGNPGMIPPNNGRWYADNSEKYVFNLEKTNELLQKMGYQKNNQGWWQKNNQPLKVELLSGNGALMGYGRLAELLGQMLAKAGIQVVFFGLEGKLVDQRIENNEFDLAITGHGGLGGDPVFLNTILSGNGFNSARYQCNESLNELLRAQVREMNPDKRRELVTKIQIQIAEDLPGLMLYYVKNYWSYCGSIPFHYVPGGIANGIPSPFHKWSFIQFAQP
jgi:peptide/nickel transport system substrate-binding protein